MTPMFASSGLTMILMVVVAMMLFSFVLQRPLKKQAAAQAELRNSISEGTRVMLASGLFGTVTHVGTEQMVVELAPGMEVTCLKQSIAKVVGPDDEEFEFAEPGLSDVDEPDEFDELDEPTAEPGAAEGGAHPALDPRGN